MGEQLRLMAVHAHPDDESSKGAATMAKYVAEGVDVLVVTCTGGERGSVLNPKLDRPEIWENIVAIRREEMERAREILGVRQAWLGFVDSGFPEGDPPPPLPDGCFGLEPVETAAAPLVRLMREFRPHVVTTYDEDGGYPHPDHVMCHKVSVAAFDAAGDPDRYPEAGEPWQPLKLYYTVWSRARVLATHQKFLELGLESPFPKEWTDGERPEPHITTSIDVSEHADVRPEALLAHATQVDPSSPFWFGLPPEVARTIHPYDEYVLARSLVDAGGGGAPPETEDDLFAGIRDRVSR